MKAIVTVTLTLLFLAVPSYGQEKGVDTQNARIRDVGNGRGPANNGTRQDVGTGRGIDFGKGKTPDTVLIANPYRVAARRDAVLKSIEAVLGERKMVLDAAASRPAEGILVSQPFTFIRGAVVAGPELGRYAELPMVSSRGWTRGQYTLIFEVQQVDGASTSVSVNARIEGRSDGASGAEWITLPSSGAAEQEFLGALIENLTGAAPNERP